jgi:excisionase family DNA binding protein
MLEGMNALTTPAHERHYLTVAQVAAELGCSEPTVRRRIRAGELPAVRLGPRGSAFRAPGFGRGCGRNQTSGETEDAASGEEEK